MKLLTQTKFKKKKTNPKNIQIIYQLKNLFIQQLIKKGKTGFSEKNLLSLKQQTRALSNVNSIQKRNARKSLIKKKKYIIRRSAKKKIFNDFHMLLKRISCSGSLFLFKYISVPTRKLRKKFNIKFLDENKRLKQALQIFNKANNNLLSELLNPEQSLKLSNELRRDMKLNKFNVRLPRRKIKYLFEIVSQKRKQTGRRRRIKLRKRYPLIARIHKSRCKK